MQCTKGKMMELLSDQGPPPAVTISEFLMSMFLKNLEEVYVLFLLGNYLEMVDKDTRTGNKEMFVGSLRGYVAAKINS